MIFSKLCAALAFACLLAPSVNVAAQSNEAPVTDITMDLQEWARHLNSDADKNLSREKAPELNRYLEALKMSLEDYMKTRKRLSDSLFRNNVAPGKKDIYHLEVLKEQMSAVMAGMRGVTDLTGRELQEEGDKLNNRIYDILYGEQTHFLSYLEAFLAGMDVTKKDLALDGSTCYQRLRECINLISNLQGRINKKMK
ncbi:hypothetical protein [Chitinophaga japonensis]|nr:hypothetical protein [Chitinophaga japonensis]